LFKSIYSIPLLKSSQSESRENDIGKTWLSGSVDVITCKLHSREI